jgi:5-methylcytosine-specific restriction endonuclease McrA
MPRHSRKPGRRVSSRSLRPASRWSLPRAGELREKLERARNLLSHANPSRDLAVVVERAIDVLLAELERKKLGKTKRPRRTARERGAQPGHIKSAVRREVFERDGLRCTYVSPDGRRCEAQAFLELDHVKPRGRAGTDDTRNLRIRCRAHNLLCAEQTYGREHVKRRRQFRQEKSMRERAGQVLQEQAGQRPAALEPEVYEKIRRALTEMRFRDAEARRAVAEVQTSHSGAQDPASIEQLIREALLVVDCGSSHRSGRQNP